MACFKSVGCGSNRAWLKTLVILDLIGYIMATVGCILLSIAVWVSSVRDVVNGVYEGYGSDILMAASIVFPLCALWCALNCHFHCMVLRAEGSGSVAHGLWKSWDNYVKICMCCKLAIAVLSACGAVVAFGATIGVRLTLVNLSVQLLLTLIHDALLLLLTKNRYQEKVAEEAEAKGKYNRYQDC